MRRKKKMMKGMRRLAAHCTDNNSIELPLSDIHSKIVVMQF